MAAGTLFLFAGVGLVLAILFLMHGVLPLEEAD